MWPVKFAEEQEADEKRLRKEIETKMIAEQLKAEEAKKQREKDEAAAVERWKAREAEKAAKEKREKEEAEREYTHRLTDQLRASGLPEDQIKAILEKRRINQGWGAQPRPFPGPPPPRMFPGPPVPPPVPVPQQQMTTTKTTYTRMARRHLSLECLKVRGIDYELDAVSHGPFASVPYPHHHTIPIHVPVDGPHEADAQKNKQNPEYVLIKRWVPPEEQKELWSLTKVIRDGREKVTTTLAIEDRSHHHHRHKSGDNLVVVKKTKRERSRSPSVSTLMYLAGAR